MANGQEYPFKPIRLIVGFPPGGAVDIVGRTLAEGLRDALGQQVFVDNRPGANGVIGTELIARASPDGYTIGLASISTVVLNALLLPRVGFKTLQDFTPIGMAGQVASVIAVHPVVPARSLGTLVSLARTRPGGVMFGSSGSGSLQHLAIEMLNGLGGVRIQHVAYKGAVPAMTDVLGGHIDGTVVSVPGAIAPIRAGKLAAIAVTSTRRSAALPETPSAPEQGFADLDVVNWYAIVAPVGLPPQIASRVHAAIAKAVTTPATRERFSGAGIEPRMEGSPEAFGAFLRSEYSRWEVIVRKSGVRLE